MKKTIDVAVAVICHQDQFLLAYRDESLHQGGKLEFVGGKVETGETPQDALVREVAEELGLDIGGQVISELGRICHDYGDKAVCLWVFLVGLSDAVYQAFLPVKTGVQGQALFWYDKQTLLTLGDKLPKANGEILAWLKDLD